MMLKLILALIPSVFVVFWTILSEKTAGKCPIQSILWVDVAGKVLGTALLFILIGHFSTRFALPGVFIGHVPKLISGMIAGGVMGFMSCISYRLFIGRSPLALEFFHKNLSKRLVGNLGVAALEETGFRAGTVYFTEQFFGNIAAATMGSVCFGLAHIGGRLLGRPVVAMHIFSASLAGLFLALLYLKAGWLACLGWHWAWNSLARSWMNSLQLGRDAALQHFESAWTTMMVLLASSISLALL